MSSFAKKLSRTFSRASGRSSSSSASAVEKTANEEQEMRPENTIRKKEVIAYEKLLEVSVLQKMNPPFNTVADFYDHVKDMETEPARVEKELRRVNRNIVKEKSKFNKKLEQNKRLSIVSKKTDINAHEATITELETENTELQKKLYELQNWRPSGKFAKIYDFSDEIKQDDILMIYNIEKNKQDNKIGYIVLTKYNKECIMYNYNPITIDRNTNTIGKTMNIKTSTLDVKITALGTALVGTKRTLDVTPITMKLPKGTNITFSNGGVLTLTLDAQMNAKSLKGTVTNKSILENNTSTLIESIIYEIVPATDLATTAQVKGIKSIILDDDVYFVYIEITNSNNDQVYQFHLKNVYDKFENEGLLNKLLDTDSKENQKIFEEITEGLRELYNNPMEKDNGKAERIVFSPTSGYNVRFPYGFYRTNSDTVLLGKSGGNIDPIIYGESMDDIKRKVIKFIPQYPQIIKLTKNKTEVFKSFYKEPNDPNDPNEYRYRKNNILNSTYQELAKEKNPFTQQSSISPAKSTPLGGYRKTKNQKSKNTKSKNKNTKNKKSKNKNTKNRKFKNKNTKNRKFKNKNTKKKNKKL